MTTISITYTVDDGYVPAHSHTVGITLDDLVNQSDDDIRKELEISAEEAFQQKALVCVSDRVVADVIRQVRELEARSGDDDA